jgi:hypothetical protein
LIWSYWFIGHSQPNALFRSSCQKIAAAHAQGHRHFTLVRPFGIKTYVLLVTGEWR